MQKINTKHILKPVVAAENGEIFELDGYGAVGMSGREKTVLKKDATVTMPHGSELMMLPGRKPVVYNILKQDFETLEHNPFDPDEKIFPVAVFNSPGFLNRHFCAYDDGEKKDLLPLFSYGAVGFSRNSFRSAAILVDKEPRQDLRLMPRDKILSGVEKIRSRYPDNRLVRHLENCALNYGCPAGKNFFLKRFEAPIPTAQACNANCLGCISLQTENNLCACQERISFTPSPDEISQIALEHIKSVKKSVVSFGQGCEGDPITAFNVIEPAIKIIRDQTKHGTINMNTNASLPGQIEQLFNTGLDAIRVSMNSVREEYYNRYFRPKSYQFKDVLESIRIAKDKSKFVAVNYLNCPGFTDCQDEFDALRNFIGTYNINMIQWRNLNFDPVQYCRIMADKTGNSKPLGMDNIIKKISSLFPNLIHGYFNPPKENYGK